MELLDDLNKTKKIINNKILGDLIDKLDDAHKIHLNNNGIMIVKLHNNPHFYEWLNFTGSMPQIKKFHSESNTSKYGVQVRKNGNADPIYITLAIISSIEKTKVHISCCDLDINRLANNIFKNDHSSGFIFNGSYFFMDKHVVDKKYGIKTDKNINLEVGINQEENLKSFHYKPIGLFNYDSNTIGDPKGNNSVYKVKYDGYSLEKIDNIKNDKNAYYKNPAYFDVKLQEPTLGSIEDTLGLLVINKTNDSLKIIKYMDFDKQYINKNIVMGNLLVYDNQEIINEEKICVAILLFPIPEKKLAMHDKVFLCDANYEKMTGDNLIDLEINSNVNFISYNDSSIRGKLVYNDKNIYLPYTNIFIKNTYPNDYAGRIPPGFPIHASDLNPRTCIMVDNNDNVIVMQVEGRNKVCGGIGMDLFDLSKLCKNMGAKYALNLDGGGSSQLLWKEKYNMMNSVGRDESQVYQISNAIFVV